MTDPKEFSYPGIVERCYEFCAWLLPKISKFPKDQRYILGNRLQNSALDMLEAFIDAAPASGQRKLIFLEEAQRRLEHVRFLLRLAYSIRMVNVKSYEYGSRVLVELGRMLGGWVRSLEGKAGERALHGAEVAASPIRRRRFRRGSDRVTGAPGDGAE